VERSDLVVAKGRRSVRPGSKGSRPRYRIDDEITLYADVNFTGRSASVRTNTPTLVPSGFNDQVSSIRIPNGQAWEVCVDMNYRNTCQVLSRSVSDLRSMGWNDRISSLRLVDDRFGEGPRGRGRGNRIDDEITLYADVNFNGRSTSVRTDTPTLAPSGFNDQTSSIRIPNGQAWEVCVDANYGNRCQVLSSSVSDLRSMGWNDRISSVRRVDDRFGDRRSNARFGNPGTLAFYDQPGYRGRVASIADDSSNLRFSARRGSVEIRGSGPWELCDQSGRCATIDQNVSDVSQLGLRGQIVSARSLNDFGRYGWYRGNQ
jgi:hypothetical protein